jgi:alpha-ketoglutarate-dependent 2,4-dichlorophenoxyacetate dioxygenase
MDIRSLTAFGVEVTGLDLRQPGPALAEACFDLFDRHALCVFADSKLDDAHHVAFSRQFGELEHAPLIRTRDQRFSLPELFDAGNLNADGTIRSDERSRLFSAGNRLWHTDSSFRPERSSYSMLLAHRIPPQGGDTEFADMRAAWAALPPAMQARIAPLEAEHTIWHSRKLAGYPEPSERETAMIPGARQPLVLVHPRTGEKALFLARHISHIVGLHRAESDALIDELVAFATQERFVYRHVWRPGDLVVWDNRCTMHRATPFDDLAYPRDMRRTTVRDRPLEAVAA